VREGIIKDRFRFFLTHILEKEKSRIFLNFSEIALTNFYIVNKVVPGTPSMSISNICIVNAFCERSISVTCFEA